jgi:hypothetical protein
MTQCSGVWSGMNDGEPWRIEVEPDRMSEREGFTVSVWVSERDWTVNPKEDVEGAFLSAQEAREVAAVLLKAADSVDRNNARVGWTTALPGEQSS